MTALLMASVANMFAAIKGAENSKLMKTEGLKERIGGVGNQFAMTEVRHPITYHLTILPSYHPTILPSYHPTILPSYHLHQPA